MTRRKRIVQKIKIKAIEKDKRKFDYKDVDIQNIEGVDKQNVKVDGKKKKRAQCHRMLQMSLSRGLYRDYEASRDSYT